MYKLEFITSILFVCLILFFPYSSLRKIKFSKKLLIAVLCAVFIIVNATYFILSANTPATTGVEWVDVDLGSKKIDSVETLIDTNLKIVKTNKITPIKKKPKNKLTKPNNKKKPIITPDGTQTGDRVILKNITGYNPETDGYIGRTQTDGQLTRVNLEQAEMFVDCYKGKVLVSAPDTLELFQRSKVIVRIAGINTEQNVLLGKLYSADKRIIETDSLEITQIMEVSLKESSDEERIKIKLLNNDSVQVIDMRKYTQWTFDVTPIVYGKTSLVVTISAYIKTKFGDKLVDRPVYEKEFEIYANNSQKFKQFWRKNYIFILIAILVIFLIVYKLIPNQKIIQYHMATSKNSNFWNAGALGLVIYILTIASFFVFKAMDMSLWYVPLVFAGVILLYTVFTAVTLRDNDKLSEKNFLTLMGMTLKKIPPLNFFFKDPKEDATDADPKD